jgi:hypothetical protein
VLCRPENRLKPLQRVSVLPGPAPGDHARIAVCEEVRVRDTDFLEIVAQRTPSLVGDEQTPQELQPPLLPNHVGDVAGSEQPPGNLAGRVLCRGGKQILVFGGILPLDAES